MASSNGKKKYTVQMSYKTQQELLGIGIEVSEMVERAENEGRKPTAREWQVFNARINEYLPAVVKQIDKSAVVADAPDGWYEKRNSDDFEYFDAAVMNEIQADIRAIMNPDTEKN